MIVAYGKKMCLRSKSPRCRIQLCYTQVELYIPNDAKHFYQIATYSRKYSCHFSCLLSCFLPIFRNFTVAAYGMKTCLRSEPPRYRIQLCHTQVSLYLPNDATQVLLIKSPHAQESILATSLVMLSSRYNTLLLR